MMATCFSNYLAAKVLNSVLLGKAFPIESTYVALHTSSPTSTGDLSTEVVGGSYARLSAPAASWTTPSNLTSAYKLTLKWLNMPAVTITHLSLWTALSGGQMLFWGALTTPIAVSSGGSINVNSNDLAIILTS